MTRLGSDKGVLGCVLDAAHKLDVVQVIAFVARTSKD
jgi:hypothetical protein